MRLEHHAEQAAGAGEITLPQGVLRMRWKCRVQYTQHLWPVFKPARHFKPAFLLLFQANGHGARTTQRQPAIIRCREMPHLGGRAAHNLIILFAIHGDGAKQHIRMPADIFRQRLDRNIHAMLEGHEVVNAPGIVHHHHAARRMRRARNSRHILHFECVAAGALRIDHLSIGADERTNTGLINQRIVIGGLNSPILQQPIADITRRAIGGIGH